MRIFLALFAIAVLLVIPIAIGLTADCISLVAPQQPLARHATRAGAAAQPLALTAATPLRGR